MVLRITLAGLDVVVFVQQKKTCGITGFGGFAGNHSAFLRVSAVKTLFSVISLSTTPIKYNPARANTMRKLILGMFVSLDGFVAGPNGEIDWVFKTGDDSTDEWIIDNLRQAGAIGMGSTSYYGMAGFWPSQDSPFAAPMNEIPKVVFTKKGLVDTPSEEPSWAKPIVGHGDLSEEVARLKAEDGKDIRVLAAPTWRSHSRRTVSSTNINS